MKTLKSTQYLQSELNLEMLDQNPFLQFEKWYKEAENAGIDMPNAMSLATCGEDRMPSVRTVLMKYFSKEGFTFFTNYNSQKAKDLEVNPQAAILFPWLEIERQVRIKGTIKKISKAASLKYFLSRPRESQLGAWCSNQSEMLSSRNMLLQKLEVMKQKFRNGEIPLPDAWGGYQITPVSFEFWQGRKSRLHDRFQYKKEKDNWEINRLAP